jgi:hypothetical protein
MKARKSSRKAGELQAEYKFDYSETRPNRFATRSSAPGRASP